MLSSSKSVCHEAMPGDENRDLFSRFMTTSELAELLHVKRNTLERARSNGLRGYPPFVKIGGRVLYDRHDVEEWLKTRKRSNDGSALN